MQKRSKIALGAAGALTAIVVGTSVAGGGAHHAAQPSGAVTHMMPGHHADKPKGHHADTVTFVVTGSNAEVTYGPAGSSHHATPPLNVTNQIPKDHPTYYSVTAQLQGGGHVSAKIEVNGKVISQATADGGYNIATAEIVGNPITGGWTNAN